MATDDAASKITPTETSTVQDTGIAIIEWQSHEELTDYGEILEQRGLTTELCDLIIGTLRQILKDIFSRSDIPKNIRIGLARTREIIVLWSDEHGIQDGKLDDIFAASRSLSKSTLRNLASIAATILYSRCIMFFIRMLNNI